jgi:hypothetical protein
MGSVKDSSPGLDDARSRTSHTLNSPYWFSGSVVLDYVPSGDEERSFRPVRVTVTVLGSDPIESVGIELSSESDLFFLFEATYDSTSYDQLRDAQDLTIEFPRFPNALTDIFTAAATRDGEFKLLFTDGEAPQLTVQQGLKFKNVTVFKLQFDRPSDEAVRNRIQGRYNEVRSELEHVKQDLTSVYAMLKIKNPSVLKQVKTPRK